jgi:hypothetical protein
MCQPTCLKTNLKKDSPMVPVSLHISPTDKILEAYSNTERSNLLNLPCAASKPQPATAAACLLATIQRSNGELEHLHVSLARIEDILAEERSRAVIVREKAHREAQQSATHIQTLSQKINEEKCKRRMLREELSTASEHLRSSIESNSALLSALKSTQEENEMVATRNRALHVKLERELETSRKNALQLKNELLNLREKLESGKMAGGIIYYSRSALVGAASVHYFGA